MKIENDEFISDEYYVAFIDILGFKNFICKSGHSSDKIFKYLSDVMQPAYKEMKLDVQGVLGNVSYTILSDSIVIYIPTSIPYSFFIIACQCFGFQKQMLYSEYHLMVRGSIAKGELTIGKKNKIIFGKGLIDAYLLEHDIANYPRIIMTEKMFNDGLSSIEIYTLVEFLKTYVIIDPVDKLRYISFGSLQDEKNSKDKIREACDIIKAKLDSETDKSIRDKLLYMQSHFVNRADIQKIINKH